METSSLDSDLNIAARHPELPAELERWSALSLARRNRPGCRLEIAFGTGALESVDLFPATSAPRGTMIFIHGGYWRSLDKAVFSFVADGFVDQGFNVCVLNYPLLPDARMADITAAVLRGIDFVLSCPEGLVVEAESTVVCGHSSGGHLAIMSALAPSAKAIGGVVAIGGIYDLDPIKRSYLNATLALTADEVTAFSPMRHLRPVASRVLFAIAENEVKEFRRQHAEIVAAWTATGQPVGDMLLAGDDHFSVLDRLTTPGDTLNAALCALMTGTTD